MSFNAADASFMAIALRLAERGRYTCAPNPAVGGVVVRDGVVVGQGFHEYAGGPHAEVMALTQAAAAARGATLYVTLEPCCHTGRTGPCTDVVRRAGVQRVVVAMEDPNPLVCGSGIRILREAGLSVDLGLMSAAAEELNQGFVARLRRGRPFVRAKLAASLDGGTALASGVSKWITGPAARRDVQWLRARSQALITGVGTVLADDPQLTLRDGQILQQLGPRYQGPMRVVIDSTLRVPATARVFESPASALVFCAEVDAERVRALNDAQVTVVPCASVSQQVDLDAVLAHLAARGVNDVLVEAGPQLTGAFLVAGLVDELIVYQAASFLGHATQRMVHLPGITQLSDRLDLSWTDIRQVGDDLRLTARFRSSHRSF